MLNFLLKKSATTCQIWSDSVPNSTLKSSFRALKTGKLDLWHSTLHSSHSNGARIFLGNPAVNLTLLDGLQNYSLRPQNK